MFSVRLGALAFALLPLGGAANYNSPYSTPVKIVESFLADMLPAAKSKDWSVLEGLFTTDAVFGNTGAGKPHEQKEVLETGLKKVGVPDWYGSIKSMKVMSAVPEIGADGLETPIAGVKVPVKVTAWVKVEMGDCPYKGTCSGDFYQWMILVPFEGAEKVGWTCTALLQSPAPPGAELLEQSAELMEQPAVGNANVSALPASVALLAAFAGGAVLSGCFFGRKEIFARLTAPQSLREPLL
jgi:hypothetical protein